MVESLVAKVYRLNTGNFVYEVPQFSVGIPFRIPLAESGNSFIPESKPRGFGDLERLSKEPDGNLRAEYSNGVTENLVRTVAGTWVTTNLPTVPPPTIRLASTAIAPLGKATGIPMFTTGTGKLTLEVDGPSDMTWSAGVSTLNILPRSIADYVVTVRVTDSYGQSVEAKCSVITPQPPVLAPLPYISGMEQTTKKVNVSGTVDPRAHKSYQLDIISGGGTRAGITNEVMTVYLDRPGSTVIRVTLRDGYGQTTYRDFRSDVQANISNTWSWPFPKRTIFVDYGGYPGHTGIDFSIAPASLGAKIFAIGPGITVDPSGWGWWFGNCVMVDHGIIEGVRAYSSYAHMRDRPLVGIGQRVDTRTHLGYIGSTGNSTGPHLHLEISTANSMYKGFNFHAWMDRRGAIGK